jgi:hypothetical protein
MLVESGLKTKAQILHELPYSQRDIETLMNLPEGYLNPDYGSVRHLPTLKAVVQPPNAERGTNVVDFEPKKPIAN